MVKLLAVEIGRLLTLPRESPLVNERSQIGSQQRTAQHALGKPQDCVITLASHRSASPHPMGRWHEPAQLEEPPQKRN